MDDQPVTKKDLSEALTATKIELTQALATKSELTEAMADLKAQIIEAVAEMVRDAQTEVLKAFISYQETAGIRMRKMEANLSNLDTGLSGRMEIVERRLWEIEKKLLLNPPAA